MCGVILDLFPGMQMDRPVEDELHASHCCLVAIGRLQVIQYTLLAYNNNYIYKTEIFERLKMYYLL